jgi:hypothetical protein
MPARTSFDWAILRVVPRVERGEQVNVGIILYCKTRDFLAARVALDRPRLAALDPSADLDAIAAALELVPLICRGAPEGGPIARLSPSERFHWLTSPKSTITQTSPVHSGIGDDPEAALDDLMTRLVLPVGGQKSPARP